MCIVSINTVLEGFLIGRGRPKLAAQALVVAMVSITVIGYWLISWKGVIGACFAFTIGAFLSTAVMQYRTWRFLREEKEVTRKQQSLDFDLSEAITMPLFSIRVTEPL